MENENKNTILSDEELKDISGGAISFTCHTIRSRKECEAIVKCKWSALNKCVAK